MLVSIARQGLNATVQFAYDRTSSRSSATSPAVTGRPTEKRWTIPAAQINGCAALFHDAGCKVTVDGNVWTPPAQHRGTGPVVTRRAAHARVRGDPRPAHPADPPRPRSASGTPTPAATTPSPKTSTPSGHDPRKAPDDRRLDHPASHRPRRVAGRPAPVVQRQRRRRPVRRAPVHHARPPSCAPSSSRPSRRRRQRRHPPRPVPRGARSPSGGRTSTASPSTSPT